MYKKILCLIFFCAIAASLPAQLSIIPKPVMMKPAKGKFTLSEQTRLFFDPELSETATYLRDYCRKYYGFTLVDGPEEQNSSAPPTSLSGTPVNVEEKSGRPYIKLVLRAPRAQYEEAYDMLINDRSIVITGSKAGIFYGVQSLLQLLDPANTSHVFEIPCMQISDHPRFRWRGLHLDVCRHFFPKEYIKQYIDRMAFYKLNTFHWHLTEDQGWRLAINKYPKLTSVGSNRKETIVGKNFDPYVGDKKPYGGFYTQDDVREIVKYAASRNVMVVPEIEMPGHSLAALTAYPELSCTGGPFAVGTTWGVYEDVFCPKEETFQFLENVLSEVIELFPSPYIHIGGDEVPKIRWKNCSHCQQFMKEHNITSEEQLQSYFVQRIERFLNQKGKKIIGWDEILEGGLAPNATVMSWRGEDGGIKAAHQQHDVIMAPGDPLYFDHCQSTNPDEPLCFGGNNYLQSVYLYEPVPAALTGDEARYVIGAQANLWTEYITTTEQLEYMVFPRLMALAEITWTQKGNKDWKEFLSRTRLHYRLLEMKKINYRVPAPELPEFSGINTENIRIELDTLPFYGTIRYTTNGTTPTEKSTKYTSPFELKLPAGKPVTLKAVFIGNSGKKSVVSSMTYTRKE